MLVVVNVESSFSFGCLAKPHKESVCLKYTAGTMDKYNITIFITSST
uniref:Uncharacterized protein n=1 Tax=Ciona intestinalis TaxID=7719 RepID=H2XKH9_CIOIN